MKTGGKVFRLVNLKKEPVASVEMPGSRSEQARERFQTGIDELNSINTKAELESALARGVKITIDGFRERHRLSNGSDGNMRGSDNRDLFDILKARSKFLIALRGAETAKVSKDKKSKKSQDVQILQSQLKAERELNDALQQQITSLLLQLQEAQINAGHP